MKYLKTYQKLYNKALENKEYDLIDEHIMRDIWELKHVCRAYEKYARSKKLDPLKADEQYGLSIKWAHEYLFGNL